MKLGTIFTTRPGRALRWLMPLPETDVVDAAGAATKDLNKGPWYGALPDSSDEEKGFKAWVEKTNPKDAVTLLKTHRQLEGLVGNSIRLPKEGEDPTKWDGWQKLGVPKEAKDYKVTRPAMPDGLKYDEAAEAAYLAHAHKVGTPPHIVQQNIDFISQQRIKEFTELKEHRGREEKALGDLYTTWGAEKDAKVAAAQRAMKHFGLTEEVTAAIEGLTGGAALMKGLATIGAQLKEGKVVDGEVVSVASKQAALAEIKQLDDKYIKDGKLSKEDRARRSELFKVAYPSQAA